MDGSRGQQGGRKRKGSKRKGRDDGEGSSGTKSSPEKEVKIEKVSDGEDEEPEFDVPINISDVKYEGERREPVSSPEIDSPKSPTSEEEREFEKQRKKEEKKKRKEEERKRKSA